MRKIISYFENLWYHHKFAILCGLLGLVMVVFAATQMSKNEKADVQISYCGPYIMSEHEISEGERGIEVFMGVESCEADLGSYYYMSRKEIEDALYENPSFMVFDKQLEENLNDAKNEYAVGDTVIWFASPAFYELMAEQGGWMPLLDLLGEMPKSGVYDQYSVILSETAFGRDFFPFLPEDTLICVRTESNYSSIMGEGNNVDSLYQSNILLLEAILAYEGGYGEIYSE